MLVFERPEFADHEFVGFVTDAAAGLRAVIAIHNSVLGPAAGGVAMYPHAAATDALAQVLRNSRVMTSKCALAGVPAGGGAAVIIGDPAMDKSNRLLEAFGRAVDRLTGRYVCGQGSGTTSDDMAIIRRRTAYVADRASQRGEIAPAVSFGVFQAIRAAVYARLGRRYLSGTRAVVLGMGSVGWHLCKHLIADGVDVFAADPDAAVLARAVETYGVTPVDMDEAFGLDVDILAPCAEDPPLNEATIARLRTGIVCGGADNPLTGDRPASAMADRGILYVPDFVANAGGLLSGLGDRGGVPRNAVERRVAAIYDTCLSVFSRAEADGVPTDIAAERLARDLIAERAASKGASTAVA